MLFGICFAIDDPENIRIASDYGYDYVEGNFQMLAGSDEKKRRNAKEYLEDYGLSCLVANCFIPSDMKTCGNRQDKKALYDYIKRGLDYGRSIGLEKVVFGSGGARNIPQDISFARGVKDTAEWLSEVVSPLLSEYQVDLMIEPLSNGECNFIHTVKEAAMLAVQADCPRIYALADLYHMHNNADTFRNITDLSGFVRHAHISYPMFRDGMRRSYPRWGDVYDYLGFFTALKEAGCNTCSIEAETKDRANDASVGLKVLRRYDAMED